jgi:tripartite-type tricarboxylate transporter receptor subunit TctC
MMSKIEETKMKFAFRKATLAVALVASPVFSMAHAASGTAQLPGMVKIVVPFSPGASNDVFGRALAKKLTEKLGVNFYVENKPGAGGIVGSNEVARAKPDGATLMFTSASFATKAATDPKLPYDALKAFAPVALVARGAMLLVEGKSDSYTVPQLIDYAKAHKGTLNYGSAGIGAIGHMSMELFNSIAGSEMTHVPYNGITGAVTDMIGGRIQAMITTPASVSGPLQSRGIHAVAVTSTERSKFFPDLPTISETVPNYSVDVWWGLYAPAGTPAAVVDKINAAVREVSHQPDMEALFAQEATEPTDMDAAAFSAYNRNQILQWQKLARERHIVASE